MRRVINLSGTLLHTNLGRALLPQASIDAVVEAMRANTSLEYDLAMRFAPFFQRRRCCAVEGMYLSLAKLNAWLHHQGNNAA